jgi:hypothetical protein
MTASVRERNPDARMTCDAGRMELLSCGVGRPPVSAVVRDPPVECGPDVAHGHELGSRILRQTLLVVRDEPAGQWRRLGTAVASS